MTLGVAQTARLAAWTTNRSVTGTFAATVPVTSNFAGLVSGRFYEDWDGLTITANNGIKSVAVYPNDSGVGSFDQTGITNDEKLSVFATTFRLDTGWGSYSTWQTGRIYQNTGIFSDDIGTRTRGYGMVITATSTANTFQFNGTLWEGAAVSGGISLTGTQIANYFGHWLCFISATSNDSGTFANWSGASGANWYERTILVDLDTGTIVGQADLNGNPNGSGIDFATQQYYCSGYTTSPGDYVYTLGEEFHQAGFTATGVQGNPFNTLSTVFTIGDTFDPIPNWRLVAGETPSPTATGSDCWILDTFDSAGQETTYVSDPAYEQAVVASTNCRAPTYQKFIVAPTAQGGPPVFTSYQG